MNYPKFSRESECAACGHNSASARFVSLEFFYPDGSYIERQCTRCGHAWRETPLYLCEDTLALAAAAPKLLTLCEQMAMGLSARRFSCAHSHAVYHTRAPCIRSWAFR